MKIITISKSDFDINDYYSVTNFNKKLQKIEEPFEVKFDYNIKEIPSAIFFNTHIASIILPKSVVTIKHDAFSDCKNLTCINLPDSIKSINDYVFYDCPNLKDISFPDNIEHIGEGAFYNTKWLEDIKKEESIYIGKVLYNAQSFKKSIFQVKEGTTQIVSSAFTDNSFIKEIKLPRTITEISNDVFYSSTLEKINLPTSLHKISITCFDDCDFLSEITIEQSKNSFLKNVESAQKFYDYYKEKIIFDDSKPLDNLLQSKSTIEEIINSSDDLVI